MLSLFLATLAASAAASPLARSSSAYPIVNTTGGYVQGTSAVFREGITVYRGIPYGASTADEKRWTAPVAPEPWSGVFNASAFGAQCAQPASSSAGIFDNPSTDISEDCLNLNVWVPENATNAPVYGKNTSAFPLRYFTAANRPPSLDLRRPL